MSNRIAGSDIHVTALIKKGEHFIVLYDDAGRAEALRTVGRWASDHDLPLFGWYEAAVIAQKIRGVKAASE